MMKNNKQILYLLITFVFFFSCNERTKILYYKDEKQRLVKDSFVNNNLASRTYLTNDSVTKKGAEIEYYLNGNIKKWSWNDSLLGKDNNYKLGKFCDILYKENRTYLKMKIDDFIVQTIYFQSDNGLVILLIQPPYFSKYKTKLIQFNDNKIDTFATYEKEVVKTDTLSWVKFNNIKLNKKYLFTYSFEDSLGTHIELNDSVSIY